MSGSIYGELSVKKQKKKKQTWLEGNRLRARSANCLFLLERNGSILPDHNRE